MPHALKKLKVYVPNVQVTYQQGQIRTEQVKSSKLVTEKAIISGNYGLIILMIVMANAFDKMKKKYIKQFSTLRKKMRTMYLLITNFKLKL